MSDLHQPTPLTSEPPAPKPSKLTMLRRKIRDLERECRDRDERIELLELWLRWQREEQGK